MDLRPVDRMTAVNLAKTIVSTNLLLDVKDELAPYIRRLYKYRMFTITEISELANVSEYKVRQATTGLEDFRARSGIKARHLDHLIRMIGSPEFAKLHIKYLVEDGATIASLSRVTGIPETNLRRWMNQGG